MKKILLVVRREYTTRIRKKSFWLLTLLVPILIGIVYAIPAYLVDKPTEQARVAVVDETSVFVHAFQSNDEARYAAAGSMAYAERMMSHDSIDIIVFIPSRETTIPSDAFLYFRTDAPSVAVQADVDKQLQTILHNMILEDVMHVSAEDYESLTNTKIRLHTKDIETGRDGFLEVKMIVGIVLALMIFVAIFMFGGQVMQGVTEEKQNRIVEVIMCSMKPFELMMGKVVGLGLLGLTQFALWVALSCVGIVGVRATHADLFTQAEQRQNVTRIATKGSDLTAQVEQAKANNEVLENKEAMDLMQGLVAIDFGVLASMFIVYFIFGYLLYASLFAACGALIDQAGDGQQFVLPVTIPLLLAIALIPVMVNEPSGTLARVLSLVPFTAPVTMLFRIPFGVSIVELGASIAMLIATFVLCTWLAAKVYERGVLLYGRKISYKEVIGWLTRRQ